MNRKEFGDAIHDLLTPEQRTVIARLHDLVIAEWFDGCAAHRESAACCVDAMTGLERERG